MRVCNVWQSSRIGVAMGEAKGQCRRLYLIAKYYIFKQYPLKVAVADLAA